jgi:hypothetical protein
VSDPVDVWTACLIDSPASVCDVQKSGDCYGCGISAYVPAACPTAYPDAGRESLPRRCHHSPVWL